MNEKCKCVLGILAHVDAGKTTLSEAILYETGQIRNLGRVDHQDAFLDTDAQERERKITIFSKQARIESEDFSITLLDTPGHVDFSAEMERTLQVLDYAILVISGTDGVQGHTKTLWKLLRHYGVPTFLFVNKMDLEGADKANLQEQLQGELSDGCIDFSWIENGNAPEDVLEEIAMTKESLLNHYMEEGELSDYEIAKAIKERLVFPCFYGSALKLQGVDFLLKGMKRFVLEEEKEEEFAARIFKVGRDARGTRLTYLKVLGGSLKVKDRFSFQKNGEKVEEKVDQIRLYSGDKFEMADCVEAGDVCVVTGPMQTFPGQGIGDLEEDTIPILEPVLNYQIYLPQEVNPVDMMTKLKQLEEEDPQLHIVWKEELKEIHAQVMGQVQIEVLIRMILDRFGVAVVFGQGNIVYKETIAKPVEGVGHFEPLRHYAEVHLLLEPGEPGSGISVSSCCSEDVLDLNWQRLIATHIEEREHPGVLTGSALTDVKITILTGRAHLKHTEGGDFRQATYRAIRQGLKSTESVLLEPVYRFTLEVPVDVIGRAMTDIRQRFGTMQDPLYVTKGSGSVKTEFAILTGIAPVATMQDYMKEVHSYTKGAGTLLLELDGYAPCHDSETVIEAIGYDSEKDLKNPTGSVFCAHGAGFVVSWDEVPDYMHLEYAYHEVAKVYEDGEENFVKPMVAVKQQKGIQSANSWELDKELQSIYEREFGMSKNDVLNEERKKWAKKKTNETKPNTVKYDKKGEPIYPKKEPMEEFIIVDGYNIIFAWEELSDLSKVNIDSARDKLKDILCNYQGYKNCRMMVVFDAYRVKGNPGKVEKYGDLEVVYTKTDETADVFIERMVHNEGKKYRVTVATNDGLEQLTVMSQGALRMSARHLFEEIERVTSSGLSLL